MTRSRFHYVPLRRVAIVTTCLAVGCTSETSTSLGQETERSDSACSAEAEQLLEPVMVFDAPAEDARPVTELAAGRFVYRCERTDAWTRIIYPAEGEAVDCSYRPPDRRCETGWVRGTLETAFFGRASTSSEPGLSV
ncbi:MAG TPA: hypothetical protein VF339_16350 [Gammaproteobacteria bacterium]